jgi:glycosyltransferase involved in cell wall biosynthesis
VLQVLPSLVPGGGSEQSLAMVDPLLVDRGIDLHLAYLDRGSELVGMLADRGVVVHDLSQGPPTVLARARRIRALLRRLQPHVVHSTLFDADLPTRLAVLGTRTRALSTWASTSYDPVRRRLEPGYGGWKRQAVRAVDAVGAHATRSRFHAVTEGVADDGVRGLHVARARVRVVERGRDLSRFTPADPPRRARARAAMGVADDDVVALNVARQFPQKGHVHLLRAVDRLAGAHPRLRLVLVGPPGPSTPAVRAELAAMAHADRVVELGQRTDVADLLAGADVFVLASVAEGAAGAVLEAMAAGVPVVATRIPGLRGWVTDGEHAVLAEPGDPGDLARALAAVLDDPAGAAARAERARAHVAARFSLERCADGMVDLYRWAAGVSGPA